MPCKAVIFDFIGTLVNCGGYSMDASRLKLYNALSAEGFEVAQDKFDAAYTVAHEKYRQVRYQQHREVTNAVWVAEALCSLGFKVSADDPRVKAALNVFFQDFIDTLATARGRENSAAPNQPSTQSGVNLKLHLCTRYLQKSAKSRHRPIF